MRRYPALTFRPPPDAGKDPAKLQSYLALVHSWLEEAEWLLSGKLDHGANLDATSLADDDHPQYPLAAGTETISGLWTFTDDVRFTGQLQEVPIADLASATEMAMPTSGNSFNVTGGTTITLLGPLPAGTRAMLHFASDTIIYHNATSLILLNAAKQLYHAKSVAMFECLDGTNWREVWNSFGGLAPGKIEMYGGTTAPPGWYLCDNTAKSRTTDEPLFVAISTAFGVGDGSTTFNLPDLRQRFPIGKAASGTGSTLGGTGGNIDHTHAVDPPDTATGTPSASFLTGVVGVGSAATGTHTHQVDIASFTSGSANPPFQAVNFIVKR